MSIIAPIWLAVHTVLSSQRRYEEDMTRQRRQHDERVRQEDDRIKAERARRSAVERAQAIYTGKDWPGS